VCVFWCLSFGVGGGEMVGERERGGVVNGLVFVCVNVDTRTDGLIDR
jgi:hypothetical protein